MLGLGPPAAPGQEDPDLTDAGKQPVTLITGAAIVDSAMSFAVVRGGHLDVTVLGALQVSGARRPGELVRARQEPGGRRRDGPGRGRARGLGRDGARRPCRAAEDRRAVHVPADRAQGGHPRVHRSRRLPYRGRAVAADRVRAGRHDRRPSASGRPRRMSRTWLTEDRTKAVRRVHDRRQQPSPRSTCTPTCTGPSGPASSLPQRHEDMGEYFRIGTHAPLHGSRAGRLLPAAQHGVCRLHRRQHLARPARSRYPTTSRSPSLPPSTPT